MVPRVEEQGQQMSPLDLPKSLSSVFSARSFSIFTRARRHPPSEQHALSPSWCLESRGCQGGSPFPLPRHRQQGKGWLCRTITSISEQWWWPKYLRAFCSFYTQVSLQGALLFGFFFKCAHFYSSTYVEGTKQLLQELSSKSGRRLAQAIIYEPYDTLSRTSGHMEQ